MRTPPDVSIFRYANGAWRWRRLVMAIGVAAGMLVYIMHVLVLPYI
jgi:hypothetical protein